MKNVPMRIISPKLPRTLNEFPDLAEAIMRREEKLDEHAYSGQTSDGVKRSHLNVQSCLFNQCNFSGSAFRESQFCDVVFRNCDLSNTDLSKCLFFRVEFTGCKLTGTNLSECNFNNVVFSECPGPYINLSQAGLKSVRFSGCQFQNGIMDHWKPTGIEFGNCNLTEAELGGTPLKGLDLTDSVIAGIRVNAVPSYELRGVSLTPGQALEVARMLGIEIR